MVSGIEKIIGRKIFPESGIAKIKRLAREVRRTRVGQGNGRAPSAPALSQQAIETQRRQKAAADKALQKQREIVEARRTARQESARQRTIGGQLRKQETISTTELLPVRLTRRDVRRIGSVPTVSSGRGTLILDPPEFTGRDLRSFTKEKFTSEIQPSQPGVEALRVTQFLPRPDKRFGIGTVRRSAQFAFGTAPQQGVSPIRAIGELVAPLQPTFTRIFGRVGEEITPGRPQRGTLITEPSLIPLEFRLATKRQRAEVLKISRPELFLPEEVRVQRETGRIAREVQAEFLPGFQEQVTATTTEKELQALQKQFEVQTETEFQKRAKEPVARIRGEQRAFFEQFKSLQQPVLSARGVGEFVGAGALSLTPVGQAALGLEFVGRGQQRLGQAILGEDLTLGQRAKLGGIGLVELGLGLAGGGLAVRGVERQADILLLKQLRQQPFKVVGTQREFFGGTRFDLLGERRLGSAVERIGIKAPTFQVGQREVSLTGGKGVSGLEFFSIEKGKRIITPLQEFGLTARIDISPLAPTVRRDILRKQIEGTGATGRGLIIRGEELTPIRFGGVSKPITTPTGKQVTGFVGGRQQKLIVEGLQLGKAPSLLEAEGGLRAVAVRPGRVAAGLDIREIGFITPKRVSGLGGVSVTDIGRPTGRLIQQQITGTELGGLVSSISEQVAPKIIPTPPRLGLGLGITTETLLRTDTLAPSTLAGISAPLQLQPSILKGVAREEAFGLLSGIGQIRDVGRVQRGKGITRLKGIQESLSGFEFGQVQVLEPRVKGRARTRPVRPLTITPLGIAPLVSPEAGFGFDFGLPGFFGLPRLGKAPTPRRKKVRGKRRVPVRPSFTGIVLGIEAPGVEVGEFGILPGTIRGLATGFDVTPTRKKKSGKKTSKKKKKK